MKEQMEYEDMKYEDMWNKKMEKLNRKKLRYTYEVLLELQTENPEKWTRENVHSFMDYKAKKLGVNNFHEKMYKEGYLFNV